MKYLRFSFVIAVLLVLAYQATAQVIKSTPYTVKNVLISSDPADAKPPLLELSEIKFVDENANNRIDGNEDCYVSFVITNKGNGHANNVSASLSSSGMVTGLNYNSSQQIGKIEKGKSLTVKYPLSGGMNLTTGKANLKFTFEEAKGFPPDVFELNIETKEFAKPDVQIVDYTFLTDNGIIKLGYPIQAKVLIQNRGQGTAENVNVAFVYPKANVFPNDKTEFAIGQMLPNSKKEIVFEFQANKLYTEKTIPITVKVTEKLGKYAQSKDMVATLDNRSDGKTINIASNANDVVVDIEQVSLTAEVDKNIPVTGAAYPNRYALIIGNEDYKSRQTGLSAESNVPFAVNDAEIFKEYAIKTLGCPEKNVTLLRNATSGEMKQNIELITQILTRLGQQGELIFYYAGHGFPDENTRVPYLIPVDIMASNLSDAIKISEVYNKFAQSKAKRITVFLDACFTGGGRESGLLAARTVKVNPFAEDIKGNIVVFAATSNDQSALPYKDKKHGMFTYYLLRKLQESKGDVSYNELEKYLRDNVSIESLRINKKAQDPKASVSSEVQSVWEGWRLK